MEEETIPKNLDLEHTLCTENKQFTTDLIVIKSTSQVEITEVDIFASECKYSL